MKILVNTPLRRLVGISYWVIEDPDGIWDFINTEIRKEWDFDVGSLPRDDPAAGAWLKDLPQRKWTLEIVEIGRVSLDEHMMRFVDPKTGYNFPEHLATRRKELRYAIENCGIVIWPIIVRREDMQVLDGYCRYTTLKEMNVPRVYAYVGTL